MIENSENLYLIETFKNKILIKDINVLLDILEKNKNNIELNKKEIELIDILTDIVKMYD